MVVRGIHLSYFFLSRFPGLACSFSSLFNSFNNLPVHFSLSFFLVTGHRHGIPDKK
jgi:hypothetical protein